MPYFFHKFKLNYIRIVNVTAQAHCYQILSSLSFPFRNSPQHLKTLLFGRGFHTLIKGVSFYSTINVGSHIIGST